MNLCTPEDLNDLSYDMILRFLDYLEHTRHNSIRTRNTRLMFIRTFFRHIACRYPSTLPLYSRIATIPCKKTQTRIVSYLEPGMVKLLIETIDKTTAGGKDEYLLFIFLIQTGLRVSELCNAQFSDLFFKDFFFHVYFAANISIKKICSVYIYLTSFIFKFYLAKIVCNVKTEFCVSS